MKKCAYCDRSDLKITKEHVVNKSFIDEYYKVGRGYANVYEKYTENYLTAKDVCSNCNNGILSQLDQYFLEFYPKNLPTEIINPSKKFKIKYEFGKLSKWLLKTVYNSERKNPYRQLPQLMYRYKNYILGREKECKLFKIFVEILSDIPREDWKSLPDLPENFDGKFNFLRIGNIILKEQTSETKDLVKHITSSNFMFHIFILNPGRHSGTAFEKIFKKYASNLGTCKLFYLDPKKNEITVTSSERDILHNLKDTFEGNKHFIDSEK